MKKQIYTNNIDNTLDTELFYRRAKTLTPGVWVFACVLIAFLVGMVIFGFQGSIKSYVYVLAEAYEGEVLLGVPDTDIDKIQLGQEIEYEGISEVDTIRTVSDTPEQIPDSDALRNRISEIGSYSQTEMAYRCTARTKLEDGYYTAKIVIAEQSPFEVLFSN